MNVTALLLHTHVIYGEPSISDCRYTYLIYFAPGIAHGDTNTDWRVMVRLYRGPLLLVIFLFLMGINVYCWRSSGVNHVLIFELDPRNHLTEQHIMELATVFGLVWAGSALIFLYSEALHIPPYINPLILAVLMIAFLFNPTKTLRHDARFWVLRVTVSTAYLLKPGLRRIGAGEAHIFQQNIFCSKISCIK